MAKIQVLKVGKSDVAYSVYIAVVKDVEVEGRKQPFSLGEDYAIFPLDSTKEQMIEKLHEAAKRVVERSRAASIKRAVIEKLELPEIEE